jgi:hypothetical protein
MRGCPTVQIVPVLFSALRNEVVLWDYFVRYSIHAERTAAKMRAACYLVNQILPRYTYVTLLTSPPS